MSSTRITHRVNAPRAIVYRALLDALPDRILLFVASDLGTGLYMPDRIIAEKLDTGLEGIQEQPLILEGRGLLYPRNSDGFVLRGKGDGGRARQGSMGQNRPPNHDPLKSHKT